MKPSIWALKRGGELAVLRQDGDDLAHRDFGRPVVGDGGDLGRELVGADSAEVEEAAVDEGRSGPGPGPVALELHALVHEQALVVDARVDEDEVAVGGGVEGRLDRGVRLARADVEHRRRVAAADHVEGDAERAVPRRRS